MDNTSIREWEMLSENTVLKQLLGEKETEILDRLLQWQDGAGDLNRQGLASLVCKFQAVRELNDEIRNYVAGYKAKIASED